MSDRERASERGRQGLFNVLQHRAVHTSGLEGPRSVGTLNRATDPCRERGRESRSNRLHLGILHARAFFPNYGVFKTARSWRT